LLVSHTVAKLIFHQIALQGPAVKEKEGGYRYEMQQAPVLGPWHPNNSKSAFIYLTTNGILRLLWQQNMTGKWHESQNELESISSSDDLITHAAICPDKSEEKTIFLETTADSIAQMELC